MTGCAAMRRQRDRAPRPRRPRAARSRRARRTRPASCLDAGAGLVVLREHQHRKPCAHQRHGSVLDLGRAEGFGMQAAGFLELERGFLRDAEAKAAATTNRFTAPRSVVDGAELQSHSQARASCRGAAAAASPTARRSSVQLATQLHDAASEAMYDLVAATLRLRPRVQRHGDVHAAA